MNQLLGLAFTTIPLVAIFRVIGLGQKYED